jgi:hypothetical protein
MSPSCPDQPSRAVVLVRLRLRGGMAIDHQLVRRWARWRTTRARSAVSREEDEPFLTSSDDEGGERKGRSRAAVTAVGWAVSRRAGAAESENKGPQRL